MSVPLLELIFKPLVVINGFLIVGGEVCAFIKVHKPKENKRMFFFICMIVCIAFKSLVKIKNFNI